MKLPWTSSQPPKTCLFVQVAESVCRYLVIERDVSLPKLIGGETFELQGPSVAAQLQERLTSLDLRVRHAVLLAPRSQLDVVSLQLPPATPAELPELVQGALLQEQDEAAAKRVSDFLITHHDSESTEVTAFTIEESLLQGWTSDFKAAGWSLAGVTFSGLGAGELLPVNGFDAAGTNVVVTLSEHDLDLAVMSGRTPILFRTIPWSVDEDHRLAERLGEEIPRTLSLAPRLPEDEPSRVLLVGDPGELEAQQRMLAELISEPVSLLDPLDRVQSRAELVGPSRFANLIGMALAWNRGELPLNFLAPRRPPKPAGPWKKLTLAGAAVTVLVLFFGSRILQERREQLTAIEERQQKLTKIAKRADKAKQIQALAAAVTDWRRDDITWIDELRTLAEQLPPAEEALVRKMSLTLDAQRHGVIDLSVQVARPEVVTQLEDTLRTGDRSVSSQRVSESDEKSKLPWGFDTRVVFEPAEPADLPVPDATVLPEKAGEFAAETSAATEGAP